MEEQILCEIYENFLAVFYYENLNQKEWQDCERKMIEINQKYWCAFCSRMLGISLSCISELQKGKTSPIWQGSEIQRFCQSRLQGVA